MAFVSGNSPDQSANTDQDPNKNPMADQAPITSAPAGGGGSGKPSGQASSKGPSQPFTNLSAYLGANGDQVAQMGNDIGGKLGTEYAGINTAIDSAAQDFSGKVKAGYTPYDQGTIDSFNANPTAVAADPSKAGAFKGMLDDRYTGPGNFQDTQDYAGLTGRVQKGAAFANQVGTIPGLQSYLSSLSPTYTQGQATLDSSLLQTNPGAVTTIQNAADPYKNLPGYLDATVNSGNQAVTQAVSDAAKAKDASGAAFNTKATGFNQSVDQKLQEAVKQAQTFNGNYNDIIQKLSHTMPTGQNNGIGTLSADEQNGLQTDQGSLDRFGQANQVLDFYGQAPGPVNQALNEMGAPSPMTLSSYLHGGNTANLPQDASTVASADDYNEAKALSDLGGSRYQAPLDQANAGKAGTYAMDGKYQTFDKAGANDLFNQVNARDKALADNYFKTNANIPAGDYAKALAQITQDPNAVQPGTGGNYMLSALNRLANGFDAPLPGYTPPPSGPPFLGPPGGDVKPGSGSAFR